MSVTSWTPQAVLANVSFRTAIEAAPAALVPPGDARVETVSAIHPIHAEFLRRFTDPFGERVHPTVLILESDAVANYSRAAAMASIRDILSISIVPRARARHILHKGSSRVFYSKSFDFYPWMVSRNNEQLVAGTPGLTGLHDVRLFGGQSAPEVDAAQVSPRDLDKPLFDALVTRWRDGYGRQDLSWDDSKLMRALNMAFHASQPPADQAATVFDYGRLLALWVSALEILVHTGDHADKAKVLKHLNGVAWIATDCRKKAQEVCRAIYRRRNDFLHGNPIDVDTVQLLMTRDSLFGAAAPLFRMALAAFLGLEREAPRSPLDEVDNLAKEIAADAAFLDYQEDFETAILQCRVG